MARRKKTRRSTVGEIAHCDVMLARWSRRSKLVNTHFRKWAQKRRRLTAKLAADLLGASSNISAAFPVVVKARALAPAPGPRRRMKLKGD